MPIGPCGNGQTWESIQDPLAILPRSNSRLLPFQTQEEQKGQERQERQKRQKTKSRAWFLDWNYDPFGTHERPLEIQSDFAAVQGQSRGATGQSEVSQGASSDRLRRHRLSWRRHGSLSFLLPPNLKTLISACLAKKYNIIRI